jgi:hypothetical protein
VSVSSSKYIELEGIKYVYDENKFNLNEKFTKYETFEFDLNDVKKIDYIMTLTEKSIKNDITFCEKQNSRF